jgi:hypothetical protein
MLKSFGKVTLKNCQTMLKMNKYNFSNFMKDKENAEEKFYFDKEESRYNNSNF